MSKELTEKKFTCDLKNGQRLTKQYIFCFADGEKAIFKTDKDCQTMQDFLDRMNKVHELEKKLEIATKALKEYADYGNWWGCLNEDKDIVEEGMFCEKGYELAHNALKEMEGVK